MFATYMAKEFASRLAARLVLSAALLALPVVAAAGVVFECSDEDGDRVVATISVGRDGVMIHSEADDDGYESVDLVLNDRLFEAIAWAGFDCLGDVEVCRVRDCDDDDIVCFGEDIHVRDGRKIRGSVVAIGGSVYVEGRVSGDVVAVGGSVTLDYGARVKGDTVALGGDLKLRDGSYVKGDAVTVGGKIMEHEDAYIGGDTVSLEFDF